jgi:hypothetical protein
MLIVIVVQPLSVANDTVSGANNTAAGSNAGPRMAALSDVSGGPPASLTQP